MKKAPFLFVLFLLVAGTLVTSGAYAKDVISVSGKVYKVGSGNTGSLSINAKEGMPAFYAEIFAIFLQKLQQRGRTVSLIKEPSLIRVPAPADYRIVFVGIPVYETPQLNIEPPMPENPHAKTAAYTQTAASPWLKATLYYDAEGRVLGGDFVLFVAELIIIAELHYAAENEWDSIMSLPRNTVSQMALPPGIARETRLLYRAKQKELEKTRLSLSQIEDIFSPISEQAIWYARWISVSGFMETIYFKDCQKQALPFYKNLYSTLFDKLFNAPLPHHGEHSATRMIEFTASELEDIADASGDYNCFIRHFNPFSRKDWLWLLQM